MASAQAAEQTGYRLTAGGRELWTGEALAIAGAYLARATGGAVERTDGEALSPSELRRLSEAAGEGAWGQ